MGSKDSEPTDSKVLLYILWAGIGVAFFLFCIRICCYL